MCRIEVPDDPPCGNQVDDSRNAEVDEKGNECITQVCIGRNEEILGIPYRRSDTPQGDSKAESKENRPSVKVPFPCPVPGLSHT